MSDLLALRKVRSKDGLYYTFLPTLSVPFAALASCKKLTDNMSASFFVYSFDEPVSYWRLLLEAAQKSPDQGDTAIDIRNDVATLLVEGRISVMETPLLDPLLNFSKTTVKTSSGKSLKLAGPLSFESNQPSKIKKVSTHNEARQYLEQCDLESPEVKEIYSHTAAAKNPNIPDDILKNLSDSAVKGEINFVEVMGPKQTSESPVELFSVFTDSDVGLGPETEACGVCKVASLVVKCNHGRQAGPSKILQIVAEPAKTSKEGYTFMGASLHVERSYGGEETVSSNLSLAGKKFESCSVLSVDSCSSNEESNELKLSDDSTRHSKKWTGDAKPQLYNIVGSSCTDSDSVTVEMYPSSVYSLEVNVEAFHKLCNEVNGQLKGWCSGMFGAMPFALTPEIKLPTGHCKLSWGWKEDVDWRAYYFVKADFGLNPIFGFSLKFEVSMLQVAGAIAGVPTVVSKFVSEYVADIIVAVYFSFDTSLIGTPSYKEYTSGEYKLAGEATKSSKGVFGVSLTVKAGHDSIFSIRASLEAETQILSEDKLELTRDGIFTESGTKVQPLICRVILVKKYFGMVGKPKSTEWKPWGDNAKDMVPSKREKFFPRD